MSGAIPPLPNASSWRRCLVKHRDNFTFAFYLYFTRRRWEDNIRMDVGKMWWKAEWIHLAQDRDEQQDVVITVMN
jgi:hypothetical protein